MMKRHGMKIIGFGAGLMLFLLLFLAAVSSAETISGVRRYTADGAAAYYEWTLDTDSGRLTLSNYYEGGTPSSSTWDSYKDQIREIYIEDEVSKIATNLFASMTNLEHVSLPRSMSAILPNAFKGDTSLTDVTFRNYNSLYNPDLTIGNYAFSGCTSLHNFLIPDQWDVSNGIDFPDTVVSIGTEAFSGCAAIEVVNLPIGKMTELGNSVFKNCSELKTAFIGGNNIKSIGTSCFSGCGKLKHLTLCDGLTSIGASAFNGCSSIEELSLPAELTAIGNSAFANCSGLQGTTTLPATVTSFGTAVFSGAGAEGFTLDLASGIAEIPTNFLRQFAGTVIIRNPQATIQSQSAFYGAIRCDAGSTAEAWAVANSAKIDFISGTPAKALGRKLAGSTTYIWRLDIQGTLHVWQSTSYDLTWKNYEPAAGWESYAQEIRKAVLDDGVTTLPDEAFRNHVLLNEVTGGSGLTSIGTRAFAGCTVLEEIAFPEGTTTIGSYAFEGCSALTDCDIPGAATLNPGVFKGCASLAEFLIPSGVSTINSELFTDCTALESIAIPGTVTKINSDAFSGCTGLQAILIPKSVTTLSLTGMPDGTEIWGEAGSTAVNTATQAGCAWGIVDTWRGPAYTWNGERESVTAERSRFASNGSYTRETETAAVSRTEYTPADCETAGREVYATAAWNNPAFALQTEEVTLPKLGHDWAKDEGQYGVEYDRGYCTVYCRRDPEHTTKYYASSTTRTAYTAETCTEPEHATYELVFAEASGVPGTTVEITGPEPAGHDWNATEYTWATDSSEATAFRQCRRAGCNETELETVAAVETVKTPATYSHRVCRDDSDLYQPGLRDPDPGKDDCRDRTPDGGLSRGGTDLHRAWPLRGAALQRLRIQD